MISLVRDVKHITRAKILNKTPPDTIFFSFLFYPEKLGGFIRFHRKRVTSCDALELNQISDAYETPPDTDLTARHIF